MLALIRAERDSLLKKNAKAKERLRDLTDAKKKITELENELRVSKIMKKD